MSITDHKGRTVSYEWGSMGERKSIIYPDGDKAVYEYDEMLRLQKMRIRRSEDMERVSRGFDDFEEIRYKYDEAGRISEKLLPEGMRALWYYDALSRLVSVSRDGNALRNYAYDALKRLTSAEEGSMDAVMQGNTVREETGGKLIHGYEYGAMNRLAKAWDDKGHEALYRNNGLGQRTEKVVNGRDEDYLLDLIKPYHNLLGINKEGSVQNFYFSWNVVAMKEKRKGSPVRVSDFGTGGGVMSGRSSYLSYWYDEFGNDLGKELEEAGIPNPYDRQGVEHPFGYTGYRYDDVGGIYFAQAREYQTENGRFTAEDVIKGNGVVPGTLNRYDYCLNSPLDFIDNNGRDALLVILIITGATLLLNGCSQQEIEFIEPVVEPQPPTSIPGSTPTSESTLTALLMNM